MVLGSGVILTLFPIQECRAFSLVFVGWFWPDPCEGTFGGDTGCVSPCWVCDAREVAVKRLLGELESVLLKSWEHSEAFHRKRGQKEGPGEERSVRCVKVKDLDSGGQERGKGGRGRQCL